MRNGSEMTLAGSVRERHLARALILACYWHDEIGHAQRDVVDAEASCPEGRELDDWSAAERARLDAASTHRREALSSFSRDTDVSREEMIAAVELIQRDPTWARKVLAEIVGRRSDVRIHVAPIGHGRLSGVTVFASGREARKAA